MNCNKLGVEVKGLLESSKEELAAPLATFVSVEKMRALVTMGDLTRFKEVRTTVVPSFDKELYKAVGVIEGEQVMTLRQDE